MNLPEETIIKLKKWAASHAWYDNDDFTADGYSGDNFDDAYAGGCRDGSIELARELLTELKIEY